jgi:hypothetical protein
VAVTGSGIDVKRSIVLRSIKSQERDASDHPNSSFSSALAGAMVHREV